RNQRTLFFFKLHIGIRHDGQVRSRNQRHRGRTVEASRDILFDERRLGTGQRTQNTKSCKREPSIHSRRNLTKRTFYLKEFEESEMTKLLQWSRGNCSHSKRKGRLNDSDLGTE